MIRREKLLHDVSEIDVEIHRRCIALGLDCRDEVALQRLAREVLWSTGALNRAASAGNVAARVKVEIYALTMIVHKINIETLGPAYVSEMDEMSILEPAWASIARAVWRELGSKGENEES